MIAELLISCCLSFCSINNPTNMNNDADSLPDRSETIYTPAPKYGGLQPSADVYEINNSTDDALDLCPSNHHTLNSYHTYLEANLDYWGGDFDIDFYYFNLFVDSEIEITISSEISTRYFNFFLVNTDYYFSGSSLTPSFDNIFYDCSTDSIKSFDGTLSAGLYFIQLTIPSTCTNFTPLNYTLDLQVEKSVFGYSVYSIGSLQCNKGLGGAYWRNDYVSESMFLADFDTLYYSNYHYLHGFSELISLTNGSSFLGEEYYFWDNQAKETLLAILSRIKDFFFTNYNPNDIRTLEITKNVVSNTITIACTIVGVASSSYTLNVTAATIGLFGPMISNHIFDMFIPKVGVSDLYYSFVLGYYIGLLTFAQNQDVVIYFPVYYTIYNSNNKIYFTKSDTFSIISDGANSTDHIGLFTGTSVSMSLFGNSYMNGKTYGLMVGETDFDFCQINTLPDIIPSAITIYPTGSTFNIPFHGGYQWLSYAASTTDEYWFYFKTNTTDDFVVKRFSNIVSGYSDSGLIQTYPINATTIDDNAKTVFFKILILSGETVYFRINGLGNIPLSNVLYAMFDITNYVNHVHTYDFEYIWKDLYNHKAKCSCGNHQEQGHVVDSGGGFSPLGGGFQLRQCLLCGGSAAVGFLHNDLNVSSLPHTRNGSYITQEGVIVLSTNDREAFFNGTLMFIYDGSTLL